jgi:hypothetical protein
MAARSTRSTGAAWRCWTTASSTSPFLDAVEAILKEDYGVRQVLRRRKANQNAPAPPR